MPKKKTGKKIHDVWAARDRVMDLFDEESEQLPDDLKSELLQEVLEGLAHRQSELEGT